MERSRRDFLVHCVRAGGALCAAGGLGAIGGLGLGFSGGCYRRANGESGAKQGGGGEGAGTGEGLGRSKTGSKEGKGEPGYLSLERKGLLEGRVEGLYRVLSDCQLCGRRCRVDRTKGEVGVCRSTAEIKASSAFAHFGEEKPLVGAKGSGTIFFSNCSLLCCYCQNWGVAHRGDGTVISCDRLAKIMVGLQSRGCHNINVVTPTHFVPQIVKAVRMAIPMGLRLPLVYNTGGYENPDVIRLLSGIVDIYLPDFKYQDPVMADRYSSGAVDYPELARHAIEEMYRQVGDLKTDDDGVAQRGVMLRHLVMPNGVAGTARFAEWVADNLSTDTYVNIMGQYRPQHWAFRYPEIARRVTPEEVRRAMRAARKAGLKNLAS